MAILNIFVVPFSVALVSLHVLLAIVEFLLEKAIEEIASQLRKLDQITESVRLLVRFVILTIRYVNEQERRRRLEHEIHEKNLQIQLLREMVERAEALNA